MQQGESGRVFGTSGGGRRASGEPEPSRFRAWLLLLGLAVGAWGEAGDRDLAVLDAGGTMKHAAPAGSLPVVSGMETESLGAPKTLRVDVPAGVPPRARSRQPVVAHATAAELNAYLPSVTPAPPGSDEFPQGPGINRMYDLGGLDDQVSIAADPSNPNHLYLASRSYWGPWGVNAVAIRLSTDQGATWGAGCVFTWDDGVNYLSSAQPSVAVSPAGVNGQRVHLAMTTYDAPSFVSVWTMPTSNFTNCAAWSAQEVVNPDGAGSSAPRIVVDDVSPIYLYLIYQSDYALGDRDWYFFRSTDGNVTWSSWLLRAWTGADELAPAMAYGSNQNLYIADEYGSTARIRLTKILGVRGTLTVGPSYYVSDSGVDAREPRVAASHGGGGNDYGVVFYSRSPSPHQIWYAPWTPAFTPAYGGFASSTVSLRYPDVTVDPAAGQFHMVFNAQQAAGEIDYAYAPFGNPSTGWVGFFAVNETGSDVRQGITGRGSVAAALACGTTYLPHIAWSDESPFGVIPNVAFERWWTPYAFDTAPVPLTYTVDGGPHTGPWNNVVAYGGSNHTIATTEPQVLGGNWYCWSSWTPIGGAISSTFTAPCSYSLQTITGSFVQTSYPDAVGNSLLGVKSGGSAAWDWADAADTTGYRVYKTGSPATVMSDPSPASIAASAWTHAGVLGDGLDWYYEVATVNGCIVRTTDYLQADFSSNAPVCNGTNVVSFSNATVGGIAPFSYLWDFGDGFTSSAANPTHTYTTPPYARTVMLTVTDGDTPTPQSSNRSRSVGFGPAVGAGFTYVKAGLEVTFDGTPSGGTGSYAYLWTFDDGGTSTAQDPFHAYAAAGSYDVTFRVVDTASGCVATSAQTIDVP